MKIRILLLLLVSCSVLAEAQTSTINKFYREHKRDKGTINANLPGWLVKLGAGICRPYVEDEEAKIALRLAHKVKRTKFLVAEDGEGRISQGEYMRLLAGVKKEGYQELIQIRDEGDNVAILSRERKGIINRILILVKEEDSFVMLSSKTKIKQKDLNRFVNDIIELELKEDEKEVIILDQTNSET